MNQNKSLKECVFWKQKVYIQKYLKENLQKFF